MSLLTYTNFFLFASLYRQTPQQLVSELQKRMLLPIYKNYTWIDDAPYSYDAVWAVALMLHKTAKALEEKTFVNGEARRLENFTYDDWEMANMFFRIMQQTNFSGMSVNTKLYLHKINIRLILVYSISVMSKC